MSSQLGHYIDGRWLGGFMLGTTGKPGTPISTLCLELNTNLYPVLEFPVHDRTRDALRNPLRESVQSSLGEGLAAALESEQG